MMMNGCNGNNAGGHEPQKKVAPRHDNNKKVERSEVRGHRRTDDGRRRFAPSAPTSPTAEGTRGRTLGTLGTLVGVSQLL